MAMKERQNKGVTTFASDEDWLRFIPHCIKVTALHFYCWCCCYNNML